MLISAERLLTPAGWREEMQVLIQDGRIISVAAASLAPDLRVPPLVPGLIDLHIHGGEVFDPARPELTALAAFLAKLLAGGVTDILLTISADDPTGLAARLAFFRQAMARQAAGELGGTRIYGLHLEGPFLNRQRPGAMLAERILPPSVETFNQLYGRDLDLIRQVTLAPELAGAAELMAFLLQKGLAVQAGHTDASYEEAQAAFALGLDSICHTFNAARPIHHRDPGILTAALLEKAVYCEVICDLVHLAPAIIRLIYQNKGRDKMLLVSDSTTGTGLPDGSYEVGGQPLLVQGGVKRRLNGALSGGICYLDQAVRNLAGLGLSLADAFYMASTTPARRLGLTDRGSIASGRLARLAAYTHELEPVFSVIGSAVYQEGVQV